ncbi:MAG: hypothetical protein AMXMBFR53_45230 [Gemmatimonadota bacterium]
MRATLTLALVLTCATPALAAGGTPNPASAPGGPGGARLHVGMWTSHLSSPGRGVDANWLVALGWRGFYGGTFVNSFGDRSFAAGIERSVSRREEGRWTGGVGYRLGVVSGYDERLLRLAARTPVLPALQVMGDVGVGKTGLELAWAGKVATLSPFMRVR